MAKLTPSSTDMTNNSSFKLAGTFHVYYHPISAFAHSSLLYLHSLGLMEASASYYTLRIDLHSYLLKYTVKGCGSLVYEGTTYSVPERKRISDRLPQTASI